MSVIRRVSQAVLVVFAMFLSAVNGTVLVPLYLEEMIDRSEVVFQGRCLANRTVRDEKTNMVVTLTTFQVYDVLKGTVGETHLIKQVGGSLPDELLEYRFRGIPTFTVGKEYVIFLAGVSSSGFSSPIGLSQGSFEINASRQVTNGRDFKDLTSRIASKVPAAALKNIESAPGRVREMDLEDFKEDRAKSIEVRTMSRAKLCSFVVGALAFAAAALAHAGGPLNSCNGAGLKYQGAGSVTLNYDGGGTLGSRTKAQADAIVTAAAAMWTNVGTASITLGRGPDLPEDVTLANYTTYYNNFSDNLSPVIYDTDGSIVDDLLGANQKNGILGFAGSVFFGAPTCRYVEGRAVINGFLPVDDTTMTNVIAHELGHLIGLDHSQLDSSQGLATSNYPLMYPIAFRNTPTLHEDDIAAVSALYPDATVGANYGTLTGSFRLADGATPILGANLWAQDINAGKLFSTVSDYLSQGNGNFSMLLPPGTYTLHAEAVDSEFTGGSSVGPYSESFPGDPSFLPPLYVAGVPMSPLTLGNGSPMQITIAAGCTATANFRFDGTGSVTACGTPPPLPTRLVNISTRGQVQTGFDVMIGGFVISGASPKTVVIRATGPSLANFGVAGALSNPQMQLVRSSDQVVVASNDDWGSAANAATIQASGFAPSNPLESAIYTSLNPGAYTAIVSGVGGVTGVGLVEVYEVDHPEVSLINISTRGKVLTGFDVMIGGFVVSGSSPQTVVVRAIGPSLANFGVAGSLANPQLQLVRQSDQTIIASNDDWGSDPNAALVQSNGFAPSNPLESAIYVTLQPGAYTAIVSGVGGGVGVGLVEVYKVGP
jgi:hypothetical protein